MHHKTKEMLRNALIAQLEEFGGNAGNMKLRGLMEQVLGREVAQEDYDLVRDELVAEGVLAKGMGKGGSLHFPEEFSLTAQEAPPPEPAKPARTTQASAPRGAANQPNQVLAHRHDDLRKNNPHVGMVDIANDGGEEKTTWVHDPHIDPELRFDSARANIENLIDDALASGDQDRMRTALEQLKRMQSPYLSWAGKAERTSFEVDAVSLHVHERIDAATILAVLQKGARGSVLVFCGKRQGLAPTHGHLPTRAAR